MREANLSDMADRSKQVSRRAELARQMDELKNMPPRGVTRCRCCKKSERDVFVLVEMGGFIFCDGCIEAAAQIIADRKAGR